MTLWRVEVSIDAVATGLPAANLFPTAQPAYAGASYVLSATTGAGISLVYLLLKLNLIHRRAIHPADPNEYFTRMSAAISATATGIDPYFQAVFDGPTGLSVPSDIDVFDNGIGFGSGGILAIEKDTGGTGDLRFITPVGTISTTCPAEGVNQPGEMRPATIGLLLQALDRPPATSAAQTLRVDFSHLKGLADAVQVSGAVMSAADPGAWSAWQESYFHTALIGPTFTQEATHERALLTYPAVDHLSGGALDDGWYRIFQGADTMAQPLPLDLTAEPSTRTLIGVWQRMPTDLVCRFSQDHGHEWRDSMIQDTKSAESASIQTYARQVWVCYHDGSRVVTQTSLDWGLSWSVPMPVAITGTNPRLVIDPDTSDQYYFYCTGGNLVLQRSFDQGVTLADGTPIIVANAVPPQDFGAVIEADRTLAVVFITLGNWITRISQDGGLSWSDA